VRSLDHFSGTLSRAGGIQFSNFTRKRLRRIRRLLVCLLPLNELRITEVSYLEVAKSSFSIPRISGNVRPLKTVLLAENMNILREMLRIFMESMSLQILEASNSAEAIGIAQSHPGKIDLLFIDVDLGGNLGLESVNRITRLRPAIPVLYMSTEIGPLEWDDYVENPTPSYFVQKPFRLEELKALLTVIFSK
jgi:CheY-like chemotaxis protein